MNSLVDQSRVMTAVIRRRGAYIRNMRKFLAAALFAAILGGMVLMAGPGAKAASAISLSETAIIDVVRDMSQIHQVRGANRYK